MTVESTAFYAFAKDRAPLAQMLLCSIFRLKGVVIMIAGTKKERSAIRDRVRSIQESWTPSECQERAREGQRRRRELARLLDLPVSDVDFWLADSLPRANLTRPTATV